MKRIVVTPKGLCYTVANAHNHVRNDDMKYSRNAVLMLIFGALSVLASYASQQHLLEIILYKGDPARSLMDLLMVLFAVMAVYQFTLMLTKVRITAKKGTDGEVGMLRSLYKMLLGIAVLFAFFWIFNQFGAFATLFATYGSMMLGWSLQAPVSGLAAWIMVTVNRPYKVGDRVQFPSLGLIGDVIKFNPMYLTLNQVGGTVGGEDAVGRMILVPNAMLFQQVIINYTYQQKKEESSYILDEVVFRVTYDSDWQTTEDILLEAAHAVTQDIIDKTGMQPFIRANTWEYGNLFYLRYMTDATDRTKIIYEIVRHATISIQKNRNIDLAMPYVYSFKRGLDVQQNGPHSTDKGETVKDLPIHSIHYDVKPDEDFMQDPEIIELAKKIADFGLQQHVVVTRELSGDGYAILFGEKRLKACLLLGWETVPATIRNEIGVDIRK